jgi:hypothetical protein
MAKNLQYVKVFEALQAAKGPVSVSTIKALDGIVPTRLSTYLWEIKKNTGFEVKADGRAVVSYELAGAGTAPVAKATAPKVAKAKVVKTAAAPKAAAPKVTKAKAVKAAPVADFDIDEMVSSKKGPVDVLDAIDTDITDFEDREYASAFVRGVA